MKTDNEVVVTGRTVGGERDEVAGHRAGRARPGDEVVGRTADGRTADLQSLVRSA